MAQRWQPEKMTIQIRIQPQRVKLMRRRLLQSLPMKELNWKSVKVQPPQLPLRPHLQHRRPQRLWEMERIKSVNNSIVKCSHLVTRGRVLTAPKRYQSQKAKSRCLAVFCHLSLCSVRYVQLADDHYDVKLSQSKALQKLNLTWKAHLLNLNLSLVQLQLPRHHQLHPHLALFHPFLHLNKRRATHQHQAVSHYLRTFEQKRMHLHSTDSLL